MITYEKNNYELAIILDKIWNKVERHKLPTFYTFK